MADLYHIVIAQGDTYQLNITWSDSEGTPVNLTSYTARMDVRTNVESSETLLTSQGASPTISLTLGGIAGTILLVISAANTAALLATSRGVYDLELVSNANVVTKILRGNVTVLPEVTR